MSDPLIRVGLPYLGGRLSAVAAGLGVPTLVSAGSLWSQREQRVGWVTIPDSAWTLGPALDSAGFTAMRLGGYRWSVEEFVDFVATSGGDCRPFPWAWWSAMDFCCEAEIAPNRAEVERRIQATVTTYGELLRSCEAWRREGVTDLPDPVPVFQGRIPDDYLWCMRGLTETIEAHHACVCPTTPDGCSAEWHRSSPGLPALVGVGSVCRRETAGREGLLPILVALHAALPKHVRLHLFGVKGEALEHVERVAPGRVASIDSMAWDMAARREPGASTIEKRAAHMKCWVGRQRARLRPPQLTLWGVDGAGG